MIRAEEACLLVTVRAAIQVVRGARPHQRGGAARGARPARARGGGRSRFSCRKSCRKLWVT